MKQFWLVAAALLLTTLLPDAASAQRGGFRGGAIGVASVRQQLVDGGTENPAVHRPPSPSWCAIVWVAAQEGLQPPKIRTIQVSLKGPADRPVTG